MSLNIEVLNNLSFKETIDFESYVTAHTEYINYNKYTDAASTMISFVGSKNQTPSKNLRIKDLSWKHPKNNLNYILEFDETKQNFVFITPYKELYITNVLGENKEPLFFKHKKKFNKNSEIRITKRINGENIEEDISGIKEWRFLNGYVYNNFLNKFKSETGAYETYFVSGVDEQGKSINELLSNEEAIEELSWRDIDPDDGSISRSGYS